MSHVLTEVDTFTATVVVPDGTDSRDDAAGDVELLAQSLANRTHHLNQHAAKTDQPNTFTPNQAFSGDIAVTGKVETGTLEVNGSADVDVNLNVDGSIDAGGDIFAGDDVIAGNEFQYGPPILRTTFIPLFRSFGQALLNLAGSFRLQFVNAGHVHVFPISLPHGAVLTSVGVLVEKAANNTMFVYLYRHDGHDFELATPIFSLTSTAAWTGSSSASGDELITATGTAQTVNNEAQDGAAGNEFFIVVVAADNNDIIHALRMAWTDPGPRNH